MQTNKSVNRRHGAQLQLSRLMCTYCGYHRSPNMVSDIRSDMHVAWRANGIADDPAAELLGVLIRVLALPI